MIGPCAKVTVTCRLVADDGRHFEGKNICLNAQPACPRLPGEDYTKCTTICQQVGHAEIQALRQAGGRARGTKAYLKGHTHYCRECQEALFGAGVTSLSLEP